MKNTHLFNAKLHRGEGKETKVEAYVAYNQPSKDLCFNLPDEDGQIYVPLKVVLETLKKLKLIK